MKKVMNILMLLVILGFAGYQIYKMPKFSKGGTTPDFTAELIDGSKFALSDLKGKYVMLDFWGSWCGPCRKDNPNLVRLNNEYHGKTFKDASGFEMLSVAIESSEKSWKRAIAQDRLAWKYHIVQKDLFKSPIASMYGVKEIPTKYLLDPQGEVIAVNPGYEETKKILDAQLN